MRFPRTSGGQKLGSRPFIYSWPSSWSTRKSDSKNYLHLDSETSDPAEPEESKVQRWAIHLSVEFSKICLLHFHLVFYIPLLLWTLLWKFRSQRPQKFYTWLESFRIKSSVSWSIYTMEVYPRDQRHLFPSRILHLISVFMDVIQKLVKEPLIRLNLREVGSRHSGQHCFELFKVYRAWRELPMTWVIKWNTA